MISKDLHNIYNLLQDAFGPQHWWPGETPFEVMVGAILTQNTAWTNVEKAIANLKARGVLSAQAIARLEQAELAELIRPAGYYNIKARRLKNFVHRFVSDYDGDVVRLREVGLCEAREWLLGINGVGRETADSILLYALEKPIFVIDAYTKRILLRHSMVDDQTDYDELQELFMSALPDDERMFNEFHALLVKCAKDFCKKTPLCDKCPLNSLLI